MPGASPILLVWYSLPTAPAGGTGAVDTRILLVFVLAVLFLNLLRARTG